MKGLIREFRIKTTRGKKNILKRLQNDAVIIFACVDLGKEQNS
jgi:hypothetical protein